MLYYSLEALIALLLVVSLVLMQQQSSFDKKGFSSIYLFQQENDLLKVWGLLESIDEKELVNDFNKMFAERNKSISINGRAFSFEGVGGKPVKSNASFNGFEIELIVYH